MYPVVCAVQNRLDLLYESFVKSNRVALIWAVPFGVGLALFAPDLVDYGLGRRWHPAVPVLVGFGLTVAFGQLGFNWDDYFRARGETRPMAWAAFLTMVSFLAAGIPLIYLDGLVGLAIATAVQTLVNVSCRVYFLRRLFSAFDIVRHGIRASAPVVPGVLLVLGARAVESGPRHLIIAIAELTVFVGMTVVSTWLLERQLLREMSSYIRGGLGKTAADEDIPTREGQPAALASVVE
jgi:O-antigen/teichoic acid export membrane protein